jgi:hypothetical protein
MEPWKSAQTAPSDAPPSPSINSTLAEYDNLLDRLEKEIGGLRGHADRLHGGEPHAVPTGKPGSAQNPAPLIHRMSENAARFDNLLSQLSVVSARIDRGL